MGYQGVGVESSKCGDGGGVGVGVQVSNTHKLLFTKVKHRPPKIVLVLGWGVLQNVTGRDAKCEGVGFITHSTSRIPASQFNNHYLCKP